MKKSILILIFLCCSGCSKFGSDFEITNKRVAHIDSVVLSNGFNNTVIHNLKPNENYKAFLDFEMEKDTVISDGSYSIQVYQNNDEEQILNFGYYSNGIPSSALGFKLVIKNDTILVNEF